MSDVCCIYTVDGIQHRYTFKCENYVGVSEKGVLCELSNIVFYMEELANEFQ